MKLKKIADGCGLYPEFTTDERETLKKAEAIFINAFGKASDEWVKQLEFDEVYGPMNMFFSPLVTIRTLLKAEQEKIMILRLEAEE